MTAVVERVTPSGLAVIEHRSLRPASQSPLTPNGNDPADVPPATVGPPSARPGDPNGVEIVDLGPARRPPGPPRPSSWSGWPEDWGTSWARLETLTDTAWGCLDLNSSIIATMPPYLVGASPSLPAAWLVNPDPDIYTSWHEFAKQLWWDFQLGEAFVVATARYENGLPARFHVVPGWMVNVEMDAGRRRYTIGSLDVTDDMLHIRYKSTVDDAHGHGPLEAGRSRLIAACALTRYATNLAANGAIPNAVITHPDELTEDQTTLLQTQWVEARLSGLGLPAVLSGGVTFETLQISPKDMALLDLSQFNESRIAVLLGVPPFLMGLPSGGDSMTYANVNAIFDYHWRSGLRPKAEPVTAALSGWLTPRGTTLEVNSDSYVQADPYQRAQTWQILIDIGVLTVEQVQIIERYSTIAPSSTPVTAGAL